MNVRAHTPYKRCTSQHCGEKNGLGLFAYACVFSSSWFHAPQSVLAGLLIGSR